MGGRAVPAAGIKQALFWPRLLTNAAGFRKMQFDAVSFQVWQDAVSDMMRKALKAQVGSLFPLREWGSQAANPCRFGNVLNFPPELPG